MRLTAELKQWAVDHLGVAATSADAELRKQLSKAVASGKLSAAKLKQLSPPLQGVDARLQGIIDQSTSGLKGEIAELKNLVAGMAKGGSTGTGTGSGGESDDPIQKALDERLKKLGLVEGDGPVTPEQVIMAGKGLGGVGGSYDQVRIKSAVEGYDGGRKAAHYEPGRTAHKHLYGKRAVNGHNGRPLDMPSEKDLAIAGAYFKFMLQAGSGGQPLPRALRMTEHDQQLVKYALHEEKFTGLLGYDEVSDRAQTEVSNRKLSEFEIKTLLDDSTSGGLEAVPIVFDDAVILTPILYGEIFPLVNLVNISRGRRVEAFSMSNPTITSGVSEGTDIPLFNTDSFISAFDTTIFNAVGAMEIGRDFLDDSPVNVGQLITQQYGQKALEWLDEQVLLGDGTTEPEGIFNASGITDLDTDNSAAGPPTVSDYEGLLFGVEKKYKQQADRGRIVYFGNETTYSRARGIAVSTTDQRRVFGMNQEDYQLFNHPFKIQQDVPNGKVGFGNMRNYRMYRRLGMQVRIERGGKSLALSNTELVVLRMRFGGQVDQAGAFVISDDMQS